ncbi:hypothetical protein A2U01_0116844, partial [Trifolium medium]|nr:hypothetical protein [Trifolium medium]
MEFLVTVAKRTAVEFPCDGGEAVFARVQGFKQVLLPFYA